MTRTPISPQTTVLADLFGAGSRQNADPSGESGLEHRANLDAEALGLERQFPAVGPECVRGIEINPYAAELARVTVWIGEIQWMRRNGFDVDRNPILRPLDTVECRDALLNADGNESKWPEVDVIIGNPPFLGAKKLSGVLGEEYASQIRKIFIGRLNSFTDLVTYWVEKARDSVVNGKAVRVGLVATNSIRSGTNLHVLERLARDTKLFSVWSDEPWTVEGAAVRVSILCYGAASILDSVKLNGIPAIRINPDLSMTSFDLSRVKKLKENSNTCFEGGQKYGNFDIAGEIARRWLQLPTNPNRRQNKDVIKPYLNALDVVRRPSDRWIIDFGVSMALSDAELYETPFEYVVRNVKPYRDTIKRRIHGDLWWIHGWPRPELRKTKAKLARFIITPVVAKHRIFMWVHPSVWPSNLLDVIARENDLTFGVLHSRFHEVWALTLGSSLEDRPRYTPSTTFETFPFPEGLTPNIPATDCAADPRAFAIAAAAKRLNELRETWLNPSDLVRHVPEVVPGYPDRLLPVDERAAAILKRRTLTNLYNERPAWLANAHRALDEAVAAAYGWPADLSDDEILRRLFELNQERAAAQAVPGAAAD